MQHVSMNHNLTQAPLYHCRPMTSGQMSQKPLEHISFLFLPYVRRTLKLLHHSTPSFLDSSCSRPWPFASNGYTL